jgi:hypothetical protein
LLRRLRKLLESLLVKEAEKRAEVFRNLPNYLKELKNFCRKIDKNVRFSSLAL